MNKLYLFIIMNSRIRKNIIADTIRTTSVQKLPILDGTTLPGGQIGYPGNLGDIATVSVPGSLPFLITHDGVQWNRVFTESQAPTFFQVLNAQNTTQLPVAGSIFLTGTAVDIPYPSIQVPDLIFLSYRDATPSVTHTVPLSSYIQAGVGFTIFGDLGTNVSYFVVKN